MLGSTRVTYISYPYCMGILDIAEQIESEKLSGKIEKMVFRFELPNLWRPARSLVFGSNFQTAAFNQRPPKKLAIYTANCGARLVFRLVKGYSNSPRIPFSSFFLDVTTKTTCQWTFQKKNNKICSYHIISYLAPFVWWDVMKKFLDTNIMFHNNQGSKPIHGRWRAKPRANLSKTHHPRFHLWICLATRWVGMFLETWKGRNYICKYMDGWSLWKGQNHSKYQKCHECLKFFHIKLNKKKWYFETHRYFFRVFSECTNNLLIVPHWWTIPYDLGMVRLDAKSSKSQGWSIFPSLPASKVSLAAAGAQRCAPMNWRRVDGC